MVSPARADDVITVLVVDDHAIVRRGLRHLLATCADMQVVGEAEDGPGALRLAADLHPDVILLDIRMPGLPGYEVAPQLRVTAPDSRIIMLTTYEDDEYLAKSIGGGAHAYVLKSSGDESVAAAIRAVSRGERLVTPSLLTKVMGQMERLSRTQARFDSGLSEVETSVLALMARGLTNRRIGQQLFMSERTVKRRVHSLMQKLGANTRAEAIIEATRRGIL